MYAENAETCPLIGELERDFPGRGGYDYAGAYVWYLIRRIGMARFKRVYAGEEDVKALLYPGFERDAVTAWKAAKANPAG